MGMVQSANVTPSNYCKMTINKIREIKKMAKNYGSNDVGQSLMFLKKSVSHSQQSKKKTKQARKVTTEIHQGK